MPGPEGATAAPDQQAVDPLANLQATLREFKTLGERLAGDFAALAVAQWRLTSYVVAGSVAVLCTRIALLCAVACLVLTSWVFFNVAVWRAVAELTPFSPAPPVALVALNGIVAGILFVWQQGVKLK